MSPTKKRFSDILIEAYLKKLSLGDSPLAEELFWKSIAEHGPFVYEYHPNHEVILTSEIIKDIFQKQTNLLEPGYEIGHAKIGYHILYISFLETLWNQEYSLPLFVQFTRQTDESLSFFNDSHFISGLQEHIGTPLTKELGTSFLSDNPKYQVLMSFCISRMESHRAAFLKNWAESYLKHKEKLK